VSVLESGMSRKDEEFEFALQTFHDATSELKDWLKEATSCVKSGDKEGLKVAVSMIGEEMADLYKKGIIK